MNFKLSQALVFVLSLNAIGFNGLAQKIDCQHAKSKLKTSKDLNFQLDTRSDSVDITHIAIDLKVIDFSSKILEGHSVVTFKPKVDNISKLTLDLASFTIDSVVSASGVMLNFSQSGFKLKINLGETFNIDQETSVRVHYRGVPASDPQGFGGFLFSGQQYAYNLGVGLSVEPHNFGRAWFPCFDNFTERQRFTTTIRTIAPKRAVCGGMLISESIEDGLTVRTWEQSEEIPTYLASVAIADYKEVNQVFNSQLNPQLPVKFHALASDTTNMKNSFTNLKRIFDSLEVKFGPYRWERIGYVLVPFMGGAMEHANNIAYPAVLVNGNTVYQQTMAHEIAHSWFGNLATCRTASEMWLNEGFASYVEFLTTEWLSGKAAYMNEVIANHRQMLNFCHVRDDGYWALSAMPGSHTYGFTTYRKGADILHTLRSYMGDQAFFDGLKNYVDQYQFTDVSAQDLFQSLSTSSGQDLTDFMNDWVLQPGWAAFQIDSMNTTGNSGNFNTQVHFSQRTKATNNPYQNVPFTLTFWGNNFESATRSVNLGPEYTHSFNLSFAPVYAVLNIDNRISQAATFDWRRIKTTGVQNLANGLLEVTTNSITDSAWVHVEHFWVGNDANLGVFNGQYRISGDRYWRIGGVRMNQLNASARFTFNGRTNSLSSGWLDNTFIDVDTNVVLLYRTDPSKAWSVHPNYQLNTLSSITDKFGNISISQLQPGEYALGLKNQTTGISEVDSRKELSIFPNPGQGLITLSTPFSVHQSEFMLFNEEGKLVLTGKVNENQLDARELNSGFYLLQLNVKGQLFYGKVLIQK